MGMRLNPNCVVPFPFPFQMHLTTAPTYFHFPPSGKRKPEDRFDIARFEYYIIKCNMTVYYIKFVVVFQLPLSGMATKLSHLVSGLKRGLVFE